MERIDSIRHTLRLDTIVFTGAFVTGVILYFTLHVYFQLSQIIVTAAVVGVMLVYAGVMWGVPRLRLRLDQAGDNAYYLGLLFTLMSMGFALYQFATEIKEGPSSGAQQIIGNFGIALASTIAGIFLRIVLNQMRVDPADVEGMTRIELAEASKRVRANLENVTIDIGRFHDEIRQRSTDVVMELIENSKSTVNSINQDLERTTKDMLTSVGNAIEDILNQTRELTRHIGETASEATKAIEALGKVAPPPLTLSRRLDNVTKGLESLGDKIEQVASNLQGTADSAGTAATEISKTFSPIALLLNTVNQAAQQMSDSHGRAIKTLEDSVAKIDTALDSVGQRLEQDRKLLVQHEEQSKRTVEESERAQQAALEVLTRLTDLTRGLTAVLSQAKEERDRTKF
jgi:methyl-accepting chemotaxis protein